MNSIGANRYFVTFIIEFTIKVWVYFLKRKSVVFETFKSFKAQTEKQSEKSLEVLRTDGGGEHVSNYFAKFCTQECEIHEIIAANGPQQNGTANRKSIMFIDMTRSMLRTKQLPKKFWAEVVSTPPYALNRCPSKRLKNVRI